jgi:hypothetical protein
MHNSPAYDPPDPLTIEDKDAAYAYWAKTLESDEDKVRQAVRHAGPLVEDVKKELGAYGVG